MGHLLQMWMQGRGPLPLRRTPRAGVERNSTALHSHWCFCMACCCQPWAPGEALVRASADCLIADGKMGTQTMALAQHCWDVGVRCDCLLLHI